MVRPRIPATCAALSAQLRPLDGALTDAEERGHRDNARVIAAMARCGAGKAVVLRRGSRDRNVFLIAPMRLRAGVTLVVEEGVGLWGSRDPREYDVTPGACGVLAEKSSGCKPLLLAEDAPHSGLMGDGVVDGRGGAKLLGGKETWWELAHRAKVEDRSQTVPRLLVVRRSNDFTMYRITMRNSPNCHVTTEATNGFTAWEVKIDTPKWARNTDGIDPQAGSKNVTIANSWIRSGDDNISPKSNATGSVTNVTVSNVHLYNGHGMSIGSQTSGGISYVRVEDLTIDGSENGLRIKSDRSRGGLVEDVMFERVCLRNSARPIVIDPFYTTFGGNKIPVYRGIVLRKVHALTPGTVVMRGLEGHPLEATLDNVVIDGEKGEDVTTQSAIFQASGPTLPLFNPNQPVPTRLEQAITVLGYGAPPTMEGSEIYNCAGKFVDFPEDRVNPVSAGTVPPEDKTLYVAADGTGDYYSVAAAMKKMPAQGGLVLVAPGVYRERVWVRESHVQLKSMNPDPARTVIVFDLSAGTQGPHPEPPGMATVRVTGDDFTAENITFENDFNRTHEQVFAGSQAQALYLGGDRNVLRNVHVLGNQDTLYVGARGCGQSSGPECVLTRSYFSNCLIAGNVDFIYGDGKAVFDDCEIHSTEHAAGGFLTAQGKHYAGQDSGFVFDHCRLTAAPGVANIYLGRPWRDFATVVFLRTAMGAHIARQGWSEWHPGETHRLATAEYGESQSTGPGTGGRKQMTPEQAAKFDPRAWLSGKDGWDPVAR